MDVGRRVCVIGGGVAGCALTWRLAAAGVQVTLVERNLVGSGSTSKNAGGVRTQFGDAASVAYAMATRRLLADWDARTEDPIDFRRIGYLFVAKSDNTAAALQQVVERQVGLGGDATWLGRRELNTLVPECNVEDVVGASWTPGDGCIDPSALTQGLRARAVALGASVIEGASVVGCNRERHQWGVRGTSGFSSQSDTVVIAAGAWTGRVAALFGANLPVMPRVSQVFRLSTFGTVRPDMPMVIGFDEGRAWIHPSGPEFLAGLDVTREGSNRTDEFEDVAPDWEAVVPLGEWLAHRMPGLGDLALSGGWAGLLELTPDERPIVGWTDVEGVYAFTGFSGHGLSIAPGMSQDAANEICHRASEAPLLAAF